MTGIVYFVAASGRIKIGHSHDVAQRIQQLRHIDMEPLVLLGSVPGTRDLEHYLHRTLAAHKIKNEWFADCDEVRAAIRQQIEQANALRRAPIHSERKVRSRASVMDCHAAAVLVQTIGWASSGAGIKDKIAAAAAKLGWSFYRTEDIWRSEARQIFAFEMDALREAANPEASLQAGWSAGLVA